MISSFNFHLIVFHLSISFLTCFALFSDTFIQSANLNQSRDDISKICTQEHIICARTEETNCNRDENGPLKCSNLAILQKMNEFFNLSIYMFDNFKGKTRARVFISPDQKFDFICDSENKSFTILPSKDKMIWSVWEMNNRVVCSAWHNVNRTIKDYSLLVENESYPKYFNNFHESYNLLFNENDMQIDTANVTANVTANDTANVTESVTAKNNSENSNSIDKKKNSVSYVMLLGYALPLVLLLTIILAITAKKMSRQEDEPGETENETENMEANRVKSENDDQNPPSTETAAQA